MSRTRAESESARAETDVAICMFAKPPRAGLAKTRLVPPLTATEAARVADAFLRDSWTAINAVPWAEVWLATTEHDDSLGIDRARAWLQGDGDLGTRVERILRRALERASAAIAIGADSPGMPPHLLEAARTALRDHDAVIGPADDGGFYLLGVRTCPTGLLADLPWSAPDTCAATLARLHARAYRTAVLPSWFDVDDHADLMRLSRLLEAGEIVAPVTRNVLRHLLPRG